MGVLRHLLTCCYHSACLTYSMELRPSFWIMKKKAYHSLGYNTEFKEILKKHSALWDTGVTVVEAQRKTCKWTSKACGIHSQQKMKQKSKEGAARMSECAQFVTDIGRWRIFFLFSSSFWKWETCTQLLGIQSLNIPGWFFSHLWQSVMDLCQKSLVLYTRFCRLLRKSLSIQQYSSTRCCLNMRRSSPIAESIFINPPCDMVPSMQSNSFLN